VTDGLPITEVGNRLDEPVRRARTEQIVLTEGDAPVAATISIEALRELQRPQGDADIALRRRSRSRAEPRLTHEEFMALLRAEDAAAT
jgi:hypothetical protein